MGWGAPNLPMGTGEQGSYHFDRGNQASASCRDSPGIAKIAQNIGQLDSHKRGPTGTIWGLRGASIWRACEHKSAQLRSGRDEIGLLGCLFRSRGQFQNPIPPTLLSNQPRSSRAPPPGGHRF